MGTYALTGSASGIGAALKASLAAQGHTLITIDIKDADIIADLTTAEGRKRRDRIRIGGCTGRP